MKQITTQFSRRALLLAGAASATLAACTGGAKQSLGAAGADTSDPYANTKWRALSEADWKAALSPLAYNVLRKEATERPFSSPLNDEERKGIFHCAGCDLPLFRSDAKYDSGTGWPSFWQPIEGALGTKSDNKLFYTRTEYHCARCLGHQGHIFDDGPAPTGLRYCNNGVALSFIAA